MKKYSTLEMLDLLMKDVTRKFQTDSERAVGIGNNGHIVWLDTNSNGGQDFVLMKNSFADNFNIRWSEIVEPVDFVTAYQDCFKNDTEYKGTSTGLTGTVHMGKAYDGSVKLELPDDKDIVYLDTRVWTKVVK